MQLTSRQKGVSAILYSYYEESMYFPEALSNPARPKYVHSTQYIAADSTRAILAGSCRLYIYFLRHGSTALSMELNAVPCD